MITHLINRPATLHRHTAGPRDEMLDVTSTYVDEPIMVELQQADTSEQRDGRTVVVSGWLALFRPDETLTALDQLSVDGARYAFDGEPWLVRHPRTGRSMHWSAKVRKVA